MKRVTLFIIFFLLSYWGEAQSVKQQIKMLDFTPIVSYSNRLHIPNASDDTLTIHSVGFGLTVIERSDVDDSYFPSIKPLDVTTPLAVTFPSIVVSPNNF